MDKDAGSQPAPESSIFDVDPDTERHMREVYNRGLRSIRNVLFVVAGATLLASALSNLSVWTRPFSIDTAIVLLINLGVVATYVLLGVWAMKRPFSAVLCGIAVDMIMQIVYWLDTGSFRGASLLTFLLFLSVLRKAKVLQRYPYLPAV